MERTKKRLTKKMIIILGMAAAVLVAVIALYFTDVNKSPVQDEQEYSIKEVSKVHMTQTITASGKVTTGETTKVSTSKGKTVRAAVVEKNEMVRKGDPLVYYTDGSHTDAPVSGVVSDIRLPKTGNRCGDSDHLKMDNTQKLYLKVMIPEDRINDVAKGNPADIVINAYVDREYEGKIIRIQSEASSMRSDEESDQGDAKQDDSDEKEESGEEDSSDDAYDDGYYGDSDEPEGTAYYAIDIAFENDGDIYPGMSASAVITVSERKDVLAVPVQAVNYTRKHKQYVERIEGKEIRKTNVETGESDPMNVEILSGLKEGDKIRIRKY